MEIATLLTEGQPLPDLTMRDHDGEPLQLSELEGKTTIFFFFPRDESRGCTVQACAIRDNWPVLRRSDIAVYGISPQDEESHQQFRQRYDLPFPLLVDEGMELSQAFGFWVEKNLLGYKYMTLARSTAIVDPGGKIRAILRNVKPRAHFDMLRVQLGLGPEADDEVLDEVVDEADETSPDETSSDEPADDGVAAAPEDTPQATDDDVTTTSEAP